MYVCNALTLFTLNNSNRSILIAKLVSIKGKSSSIGQALTEHAKLNPLLD